MRYILIILVHFVIESDLLLHMCFQCGQPMETKKCLECNAQIGGADHRALANNRAINLNDRLVSV